MRGVSLCPGDGRHEGEAFHEVDKRPDRHLKGLEEAGLFIYRTRGASPGPMPRGPLLLVYPDGVWCHSITAT